MNNRFKALVGTVVLLSLSAMALAAIDGLSIKRQPKEGQAYKLKMTAELQFSGQDVVFTALMDTKVSKVNADGSFTEEEHQHDVKVNVGGQEMTPPDSPGQEITFNADGSLKEIKGEGDSAGPGGYRMQTLESLVEPGKPVNVGDTWTIDIKADSKTGVEAAKASYKVVAEEKVGDIETIKIQSTVKESAGSDPASIEATTWVSKADGSLVKEEAKWINAPIPGAPAPLNGTVHIVRL